MTFWEKMTHQVLLRLNLTSPIIFTGTQTVLKVMKSVAIPYYDCSPNQLCNKLGGIVAITTYLQISENANWSTKRCADKTHMQLASAGKLAPALSTQTKVNLLIPSCFICGKSLIVFSYCLAFTYLATLLFHENCSFAQSLVPLQLALLLPMEGSICHRAIVPPMSFYV